TYHMTRRLDIQAGARESHIAQRYQESNVGPYATLFLGHASPDVGPTVHASANAFTYLVTPRLTLSKTFMAYLRFASGYRPGGPNAVPGAPAQYQPDKTVDY